MCRVWTGEQEAEGARAPGTCVLLSLKREERTRALLMLSAFAIMATETWTSPQGQRLPRQLKPGRSTPNRANGFGELHASQRSQNPAPQLRSVVPPNASPNGTSSLSRTLSGKLPGTTYLPPGPGREPPVPSPLPTSLTLQLGEGKGQRAEGKGPVTGGQWQTRPSRHTAVLSMVPGAC